MQKLSSLCVWNNMYGTIWQRFIYSQNSSIKNREDFQNLCIFQQPENVRAPSLQLTYMTANTNCVLELGHAIQVLQ
jgi:hypothetical protein